MFAALTVARSSGSLNVTTRSESSGTPVAPFAGAICVMAGGAVSSAIVPRSTRPSSVNVRRARPVPMGSRTVSDHRRGCASDTVANEKRPSGPVSANSRLAPRTSSATTLGAGDPSGKLTAPLTLAAGSSTIRRPLRFAPGVIWSPIEPRRPVTGSVAVIVNVRAARFTKAKAPAASVEAWQSPSHPVAGDPVSRTFTGRVTGWPFASTTTPLTWLSPTRATMMFAVCPL